jgi:hypothetical protein
MAGLSRATQDSEKAKLEVIWRLDHEHVVNTKRIYRTLEWFVVVEEYFECKWNCSFDCFLDGTLNG